MSLSPEQPGPLADMGSVATTAARTASMTCRASHQRQESWRAVMACLTYVDAMPLPCRCLEHLQIAERELEIR